MAHSPLPNATKNEDTIPATDTVTEKVTETEILTPAEETDDQVEVIKFKVDPESMQRLRESLRQLRYDHIKKKWQPLDTQEVLKKITPLPQTNI